MIQGPAATFAPRATVARKAGHYEPLPTFDEALEAVQRVVPLSRDFSKISLSVLETFRLQLPDAFAASLRAVHQAGVFHHPQVLRNRLTRNRKAFGEFRDRH